MMDRHAAEVFASAWIAQWNAGELEAILAHYVDGVRFHSPRAMAVVGQPELVGKPALASYWRAARGQIASLHFTLDRTIWDGERSELAVLYVSAIDGRRTRVCEIFRFDAAGRVVESEALYGAPAT